MLYTYRKEVQDLMHASSGSCLNDVCRSKVQPWQRNCSMRSGAGVFLQYLSMLKVDLDDLGV